MLRTELRGRLLADRGIVVEECCDRCGQLLGAVRFTRKNEPGVWCSRGCRGDIERPAIRKGGRPRKHRTNADRQAAYRASLGVTKPPCSFAETNDLQAQKSSLSTTPLTTMEEAFREEFDGTLKNGDNAGRTPFPLPQSEEQNAAR